MLASQWLLATLLLVWSSEEQSREAWGGRRGRSVGETAVDVRKEEACEQRFFFVTVFSLYLLKVAQSNDCLI
jgi:hypothetical protein